MNRAKKVTVIGGGTGTFVVLSGLKIYEDISLKAIVAMTDSGGSTGTLRDEYGVLPVGDLRQCLVALAEDTNSQANLMRELFLYRFKKGSFEGHNFGNLFLTAMADILGSEKEAVLFASNVLNVKGDIIPITNKNVDLVAEYEDGTVLVEEANIDEPDSRHDKTSKITDLRIQPKAELLKQARETILDSDFIILGPGDLYTSLLANFVVEGAKEAMRKSQAHLIYVTNLMNKYGQTYNYSYQNYLDEIKKYAGRSPDTVLINNREIPQDILNTYKNKENSLPVRDELTDQTEVNIIRTDLLSDTIYKQSSCDNVKRSLIRHDPQKLARNLHKIISQ